MKKSSFILTLLLPVLCFSMVACGKNSENKTSSKDKPSLIAKSQETAPHQDKRLAFEKIHIASADQEFKGGSSIEDLTSLFGNPSKHEKNLLVMLPSIITLGHLIKSLSKQICIKTLPLSNPLLILLLIENPKSL